MSYHNPFLFETGFEELIFHHPPLGVDNGLQYRIYFTPNYPRVIEGLIMLSQ